MHGRSRVARAVSGFLAAAGFVLAVYLAAVAALWLLQDHLVYHPGVPSREVVRSPADAGLEHRDIRLQTDDGVALAGWYVPAPAADAPVVLFFHGNAGNIGHRLETLRLLHDAGLSSLIIDYRGFGDSEGQPSEAGTYRDADAAWRWLTIDQAVPPQRIVLFGRSLGGAVAAELAARTGPAGLVLESAFTSLPDLAAALYPWIPVRLLIRYQYDTADALRRFEGPILVAHSPADELIPFAHAQRLAAIHPGRTELFELSGKHDEAFFVSQPAYGRALAAFAHRATRHRAPADAGGDDR